MNRSSAATTAAASSAEALGATMLSFGRRFTVVGQRIVPTVTELPVLDQEAVLRAVSVEVAIARVRDALIHFHRGEWAMPAKVYLESPPFGDFRAMPARGGEFALLKWVTSFPANPDRGLPAVMGVICLSDTETGEPLMLLDARSVTALRTGAVAAVAAQALARADASTVGIIGCGIHGTWAARCLAAAGYGPGVCHDARVGHAEALAHELEWKVGSREAALGCDVVCCVTPGDVIVVEAGDLHAGVHLNMLGADGPGKAEASVGAVSSCVLFCDEWEQASHGGELTGAVNAGLVTRSDVTELGAVLTGDTPGRPGPEAVTLFDSTGLAIQDLAVAAAAFSAWEDRRVEAQSVRL
jgi:ornithine cyclodeaminase/alanine dehydrogenase-like protein (mu-crystallin family)